MQVCKIGPLKSFTMPPSWKRCTYRIAGSGRPELPVISFQPDNYPDTELGVFFRGRLESSEVGTKFAALLTDHRNSTRAITPLTPKQIVELTEVLDLAGFNQFAFPPAEYGCVPDFNLRSAEVKTLGGKPVIVVDGEFVAQGTADTWYSGIYIDADGSGRKIYELFLRSANRESFFTFLKHFNEAVSSIRWEETAKDTSELNLRINQALSSWDT
ncbi:MAG: hypothetical protein K2W95_14880 [Candidatus Obscuribacterales bacterium]|nr:hypothetical protein [Candidatus Obscuribacterales bacterium]